MRQLTKVLLATYLWGCSAPSPDPMPSDPGPGPGNPAQPGGPNPGAPAGDGSFSATVGSPSSFLRQGESVDLKVTVDRSGGYAGPIEIAVTAGPAALSSTPVTLAAGETIGVLRVAASADSVQGDAELELTVRGFSSSAKLTVPLLVAGRPGTLDQSFADAGMRSTVFNTSTLPRGSVVQSDGKLVVAFGGGAFLARYTTDGDLDPMFGNQGVVSTPSGAGGAVTVQAQPDRRLVALTSSFRVVRVLPTGALDPSFGTGGATTESAFAAYLAAEKDPANRRFVVRALALQPDGRILVGGGLEYNNIAQMRMAVARLNPDGSTDTTFGTAGAFTLPTRGSQQLEQLRIQPDGKILLVGSAVARLTPAGVLDPTFGSEGVLAGYAGDAVIQSDGKLVLASVGTLTRVSATGAPDSTFGVGGKLQLGEGEGVGHLEQQADGKLVAAGYASRSTLIVRLTADGKPDTGFAPAGKLAMDADTSSDRALAIGVAPDGRLLVTAGTYSNMTGVAENKLVALRLWP